MKQTRITQITQHEGIVLRPKIYPKIGITQHNTACCVTARNTTKSLVLLTWLNTGDCALRLGDANIFKGFDLKIYLVHLTIASV